MKNAIFNYYIFFSILVLIILSACQPPQPTPVHTIAVYSQVDSLPPVLAWVERLDSLGNLCERIRYDPHSGMPTVVEQYWYDSQNHEVMGMRTLPGDTAYAPQTWQTWYNPAGKVARHLFVAHLGQRKDSFERVHQYDMQGRFTTTQHRSNAFGSNETVLYLYGSNDSLQSTASVGNDGKQRLKDTIFYQRDSKTVLRNALNGEFLWKNTQTMRNGRPWLAQTYSHGFSRNGWIPEEDTLYIYAGERLTRQIITTHRTTEWCGMTRKQQVKTLRYVYE